LFDRVSDVVVEALNSGTALPKDRAAEALRAIERISEEVNAAWPPYKRFRFEVLDLKDILVITQSIRMDSRFFVFALSQPDGKTSRRLWRKVSLLDEDSLPETSPWMELEVVSAHRGPSANPRFLVRSTDGGCAGSYGVGYDLFQWNHEVGGIDKLIGIKGARGLDDQVKGFPWIGEFHADGPLIDLPYCWFSPIETWDNPSLCAVDRYDLSGDGIRFVSRRVNRPDLLPIAKALEYAQKRDFGAVRGYCTNDAVARRLVEWAPERVFEVEIKVKRLGPGRELVYEESDSYRFTVEKRGQHWLIAALRMD
jgi:hypothetical protein